MVHMMYEVLYVFSRIVCHQCLLTKGGECPESMIFLNILKELGFVFDHKLLNFKEHIISGQGGVEGIFT